MLTFARIPFLLTMSVPEELALNFYLLILALFLLVVVVALLLFWFRYCFLIFDVVVTSVNNTAI